MAKALKKNQEEIQGRTRHSEFLEFALKVSMGSDHFSKVVPQFGQLTQMMVNLGVLPLFFDLAYCS